MLDQISRNFRQFGTTLILFLIKFVVAHPLFLGGEGGYGDFFSQEIIYLCYPNAVYRISISYYAWNMLKSLCAVVGAVVGVNL